MKLRSILAVLAVTTSAQANIVERIVAVVDDRPILMSELHHRSEPELRASNASESEVHRRVLDQMIAEQLVAKEAQRAHLFVTVDEIDRAIAAQTKQVGNLQAQLAGLGMTEQEYRDELRRQILEGKLVQLRVAGRVRVTEADARDSYAKWSIDFRKSEPLDANVLQAYGLQIMPPITGPADICDTARRILTTRFDCGRRTLMLAAIPSPVHERLAALEPGDVTPPIRVSADELDLVQLLARLAPPAFDEVHDAMIRLAKETAMARERDAYLAEIRRRTYVDVRL